MSAGRPHTTEENDLLCAASAAARDGDRAQSMELLKEFKVKRNVGDIDGDAAALLGGAPDSPEGVATEE